MNATEQYFSVVQFITPHKSRADPGNSKPGCCSSSSEFASSRHRRDNLGSGGMSPPRRILKSRFSEMIFATLKFELLTAKKNSIRNEKKTSDLIFKNFKKTNKAHIAKTS